MNTFVWQCLNSTVLSGEGCKYVDNAIILIFKHIFNVLCLLRNIHMNIHVQYCNI